jgi:hypothetical protein
MRVTPFVLLTKAPPSATCSVKSKVSLPAVLPQSGKNGPMSMVRNR